MAGVLDTSMEVVTVTNGENCNAIEYLNGNDDLPVCIDLNKTTGKITLWLHSVAKNKILKKLKS